MAQIEPTLTEEDLQGMFRGRPRDDPDRTYAHPDEGESVESSAGETGPSLDGIAPVRWTVYLVHLERGHHAEDTTLLCQLTPTNQDAVTSLFETIGRRL